MIYESATIEITLHDGDVTARLHGHYVEPIPNSGDSSRPTKARFCRTYPLKSRTAIAEYERRCIATQKNYPYMSSDQVEDAALLAWVNEMEAIRAGTEK